MEETTIETVNRCRICSVLIEAWFAFCERHREDDPSINKTEATKEAFKTFLDPKLQGRP